MEKEAKLQTWTAREQKNRLNQTARTVDKMFLTKENLRAAYERLPFEKKKFEDAVKDIKLTPDKSQFAEGLAEGMYNINRINANMDKDAAAEEEYLKLSRIINEYKKQQYRGLIEQAKDVILNSDFWKDKKLGVLNKRETAYRIVLDTAGRTDPEGAKRLWEEYFAPIAVNEAKATRYVESLNNRIAALKLNPAERVLVQAFGIDVTRRDELPEYLDGRTADFKPRIKFDANFLERKGTHTALDAVAGFDQYVRGIKDVIYHTGDIQKATGTGDGNQRATHGQRNTK